MSIAQWTQWLEILKEYGPIAGLFLAFIYWQARRIDKLIEKNASIYQEEINRMAKVQDRLLNQLLGPQSSSSNAPSVEQLQRVASDIGEKKDRES